MVATGGQDVRVRIMADHEPHLTWFDRPGRVRNVPPEEVGLPRGVVDGLHAWARDFDGRTAQLHDVSG